VIPVYAFVEGDTLGLLVLAQEPETVAALIDRVQGAASVRVRRFGPAVLRHANRILDPRERVGNTGIAPLDRLDIVRAS
jgi:hypothetical protein